MNTTLLVYIPQAMYNKNTLLRHYVEREHQKNASAIQEISSNITNCIV